MIPKKKIYAAQSLFQYYQSDSCPDHYLFTCEKIGLHNFKHGATSKHGNFIETKNEKY